MHPDYADPERRRALFALLDRTWPGFARRIRRAGQMGWRWERISTPFARFEDGIALAHVGVVDLPVWLDGRERRVAGLHGVCTHPEHRGQGHFRAVMEQALRWVDERFELAKLSTGQPRLYERFGFRVLEQYVFSLDLSRDGGGSARALAEDDLPWIRDRLLSRTPVSDAFTALDEGWLLGIDEALWTGGIDHLHAVDNVLVAWEVEGDTLQLYDVVWSEPVELSVLLDACPWPFRRVVLWFTPDRIAPQAQAVNWPDDDVLMVRGQWPDFASFEGRIAVPPLAQH